MQNTITAAQILVLEDNPQDRQLLEETLKSEGMVFEIAHAQTKNEFQTALNKNKFDLILCDFGIPGYDGLAALTLSKQLQPETPFIFVSGTIGEERAVESLRLGATDYVLKDRLGRLAKVVERALKEVRERQQREQDVLRRKQLEEQLHQSQKMDAIGQLAGGIAHDFNNLLLIIHGNAELVSQEEKKLSPQSRQSLDHVISAAERATNLIRQLLAFSRKQVVQFQSYDLNQGIGNLAKMLDRIIGEDVTLKCNFALNLPSIYADSGLVEQALVNLIVNARDAMPQGGLLTINTESTNIDQAYIENHSAAQIGKFVCVMVRDTGEGIAPENLPRIFEPFFTTKEIGKGTGLGLAMVYGIVKQHGGWVEVDSQPGKGTIFKIFLPVSTGTNNVLLDATGENSAGGSEKILLVEDDSDVRTFVRQVLENVGYTICEAGSGVEALKVWRANGVPFDLLLTDIVMPGGMNGGQLAEKLRTEQPELKVIFMSGYNPEIAGKIQPQGCFLQKPYSINFLIETVRACLDAESKARVS